MPEYFGEGLTGSNGYSRARWLALWFAGTLSLLGMASFLIRREWSIPSYVALYVGLISVTPWPEQFSRYTMPLVPLLALSLLQMITDVARNPWLERLGGWRHAGKVCLIMTTVYLVGKNATTAIHIYHDHLEACRKRSSLHDPLVMNLFFYDRAWQANDAALAWLREHASGDDLVATSTPQWAYLRTGLKAVMPPMGVDPLQAQRLVDSAKIDYLLIDEFREDTIKMFMVYLVPMIEKNKDKWEIVYSSRDNVTRVYHRVR
jgi:hypothetical protein